MDMLGVNKLMMKSKKQSNKRYNKKEIKVTYISSPMKVKTSASNFRALVQELTGLDSNVAEKIFMGEACQYGGENGHDVNRVFAQQWRLGAGEGFVVEEASCLKPDYSIDDHQLNSRSFMELPLNQLHIQCHDLLSIDYLL